MTLLIQAVFLFLLVFPKGGFKLGGLPITWGYVLLTIAFVISLFRPIKIEKIRCEAMLCLIPFQTISAITLFINGNNSPESTIAFFMAFFFLPLFAFFIILPSTLRLEVFLPILKKGVFFIAIYGIFLFVYQITTNSFFEIPFLTTNYSDLGLLDQKCNLRVDGICKLISTYNNGNIYGLCIMLLLPLYSLEEKSGWKQSIVKISALLTLSRTIWIGLLIHEILCTFFIHKKFKSLFIKLFVPILIIVGLVHYLNFDWDFIWDKNLGGRIDQLDVFSELTFFSKMPFEGITEIVYLGILSSFGVIGLIAYLLAIIGPIILSFSIPKQPIYTAIRCGLFNYLFISFSDGAILLIPVMAIFWFLSSITLSQSPSWERSIS